MRIVFVNGNYCTEESANISVFDRGFLFADGVYEVTSVIDGKLIDHGRHLERLHRSLQALAIESPLTDNELTHVHRQLVQKNQLTEGLVYLQITRGPAERDFAFPKDTQPSVIAFTQQRAIVDNPLAQSGLNVVTAEDIRWQRCDLKTIGLLAPSMIKQQALNDGADDAWMVDQQGFVTEGTSNNCFILNRDDELITRQLSRHILHGITRRAVLQVAAESTIKIVERPFSPAEACQAKEAFISSAAACCLPVVKIDGHLIGSGQPGPVFKRIRSAYFDFARKNSN